LKKKRPGRSLRGGAVCLSGRRGRRWPSSGPNDGGCAVDPVAQMEGVGEKTANVGREWFKTVRIF